MVAGLFFACVDTCEKLRKPQPLLSSSLPLSTAAEALTRTCRRQVAGWLFACVDTCEKLRKPQPLLSSSLPLSIAAEALTTAAEVKQRITRVVVSAAVVSRRSREERGMADWWPVFVAVVLFVLLSPGLLFQIPSKGKVVEFGTLQTSSIAIFIYSILFLGLAAVFMLAVGVHVYLG
ncbi:hypothetical protein C4D60_Mb11t17300 [Musa balbisiana]|uniref:Transmembrane protein n=1 Tax=Musa balbisiana TaxID=52838 RepID=A0A4S8J4R6_MUSBA|nr:hypothetical protein C4D60_Mb11t17300 [Musa balbisiana]